MVYISGMTKEPEPDIRKSVTLSGGMWREIRDYADQERIKTDAEAMRRLLQYALKRLLKKGAA